ncbi:MAG: hypothetical protein JJU06_04125 [Ectothiorhodospiraceae bacterium]|nr:hypothetical protein [Ectothiorhodospiraceae bacterium]MCH8505403.1 hypothetical protein [Ectothiorhodospiraceae bacterium]
MWRLIVFVGLFAATFLGVSIIRDSLSPSALDQLENKLKGADWEDCAVAASRKHDSLLELKVTADGLSVTTEIYKESLRRESPENNGNEFLADSLNQRQDGSHYATFTSLAIISAQPHGYLLRAKTCELADHGQRGEVPSCALPMREIECRSRIR